MKNIALLDDNAIDLFLNEKILRNVFPDAKISKYSDPEVLSDQIEKGELKPELLICDKQMPKLNGFQVAKRLETKVSKIILLTATITPEDETKMKDAHYLELWEKPLDVAKIEFLLCP